MTIVLPDATTTVTVAVCCSPPPVAVRVMGYVPVAVFDPTEIVMVELPEPGAAIVLGLKLTVAPAGAPEAERAIELLKPPLTVVVMVDVPWFPGATVIEVGDAESVKLGPVVTVRATFAFCWLPPPLPVTVIE